MDFNNFLGEFYTSYDPAKGQRKGQYFMNLLREKNFGIYHAIPWDLDPFHDDKLLPQCIEWVSERWGRFS
jgi:hypothetical protein